MAASYSILARTAATDTHALSFLGLEASALWEGELSLVRVCSCFSTMHIDYVEVLALAACLVLVSLPALPGGWLFSLRSLLKAAAAIRRRGGSRLLWCHAAAAAASFASYFLPPPQK